VISTTPASSTAGRSTKQGEDVGALTVTNAVVKDVIVMRYPAPELPELVVPRVRTGDERDVIARSPRTRKYRRTGSSQHRDTGHWDAHNGCWGSKGLVLVSISPNWE
jgi:hypothetical protein